MLMPKGTHSRSMSVDRRQLIDAVGRRSFSPGYTLSPGRQANWRLMPKTTHTYGTSADRCQLIDAVDRRSFSSGYTLRSDEASQLEADAEKRAF